MVTMPLRRACSVLVLGLGALLSAAPAGSAAPVADVAAFLAPAAECAGARRSPAELAALLVAPPGILREGMAGVAVATPAPPPPLAGLPADAATADAVAATARVALACLNAGDFPRLFALFSDHYLWGVWGGFAGPDAPEAVVAAGVRGLATPVPRPVEQQIALIMVDDVRVLPDGRVLATVVTSAGSARVTFVRVGERYLIEWVFALPEQEA